MKSLVPILRGGCQTTKGLLLHRLAPALLLLGLVALLGHFTAGRVEGTEVKHEDLSNQIRDVQTSVDAIQSQLDHIPPAWSQTLPAAERFVLVLGGAAVLDKETGLVWEQSPDTNDRNWFSAQNFCNSRTVGGRKGWRLPTVQELASLVDPNNPGGSLPPGHPFTNVQASAYWSATTLFSDPLLGNVPDSAWAVEFSAGFVVVSDKSFHRDLWCVRGGHGGPDAQ